jgi:exodeoxyribonuclease VII large subunit
LIRNRLANAGERLARTGLSPVLLERRLTGAKDRLAGLERVLSQLDPDKPLARGFARVTDAAGQTLTSKAQSAKEPSLVLKFGDGDLPVTVGASGSPPPAPRKPRPKSESTRQGDLF